MSRLIDADELINNLAKAIPHIIDDAVTDAYVEGLGRAKIEIEDMPTIEQERKTGKWIKVHWKAFRCSECNKISEYFTNFCPNCGSRMLEEGEEND